MHISYHRHEIASKSCQCVSPIATIFRKKSQSRDLKPMSKTTYIFIINYGIQKFEITFVS